nr:PREDICTED: trypsin-like [Linepithema humile]
MGLTSNSKMSSKAIVFFALLAVAFAGKSIFRPRLGLRVPYLPSLAFSPQVVGGDEASQNAHPYIVSLQWGTSSATTSHFCAGSILNSQWILTAGHCVQAVPSAGTFLVKAGKHHINIVETTEQTVKVLKSFVHEKYQGGVGPYDVGLLKLSTPLELNSEVQPIELPEAESEPTGDAILIGWGSTSRSGIPNMPDKLQIVDLHYVDRKTCHEAVERLTGSSPVHETNVCTGPLTGGISACSGDSGGPLVKRYGNKEKITGIVSWGIIPCGTVGAPSVYTKVSKFNDWLHEKMSNN